MFRWLYKLLFVAITFSFFVSATEMDLGDCHNTFFDEYDVYVKTEQVSLDHSTIEQQLLNSYTLVHCAFFYFQSLEQHERTIVCQIKDYDNASPPKLFLRNSVWRIWYPYTNLQVIASAFTLFALHLSRKSIGFPSLIQLFHELIRQNNPFFHLQ